MITFKTPEQLDFDATSELADDVSAVESQAHHEAANLHCMMLRTKQTPEQIIDLIDDHGTLDIKDQLERTMKHYRSLVMTCFLGNVEAQG